MPDRWPPLNLPNPNDGIPSQRHRHDAQDITGTFTNIILAGDLWSANWDGGYDLSAGRDATATLGYLLDSSCGAAQFVTIYADGGQLRTLTVTGTLTLSGSGNLVTAASGQRVEIAAATFDRITFYSGSDEGAGEAAGYIQSSDPGAGWARMQIIGPHDGGISSGVIWLDANSGNIRLRPAGGSGFTLDLTSVGMSHLLPISGTQNIGSGANPWGNLYAAAIYDEAGNTALDTSTVVDTTYTPTIAGSTGGVLGNGTVNGWYRRINKMVWGELRFVWGTTTTFTGTLTATYPVTAIGYGATVSVGSGRVITGGGANTWLVDAVHASVTTIGFRYDQQTGGGTVTDLAPAAFAANDVITVHFHYTAA